MNFLKQINELFRIYEFSIDIDELDLREKLEKLQETDPLVRRYSLWEIKVDWIREELSIMRKLFSYVGGISFIENGRQLEIAFTK